jgi:hypothetical protein
MAGVLCGIMIYALMHYFLGLREWAVDEDEPIPA